MRRTFQRISSGRGRAAVAAAFGLTAAFGALALVPAAGFAQGGAAPAGAANNLPKFGSVDMGKLQNEYKGRRAYEQEINKFQTELDGILRRMVQGSAAFLIDAEINELVGLYEKPAPNDADKKRIQTLEAKGDQQSVALSQLQNTASPDAAQQSQLQQLTEAQSRGQRAIQGLNRRYAERIEDKIKELQLKMFADMQVVVAKVAKQKGLAMVFNGSVAVYTENDITEDVLKTLNAGK